MALTVVVAYDISDDGRRARVAAALQQWGDRIQKSVFICTVAKDDLAKLTELLHRLINDSTDSVYVLRQCATCWNKVDVLGQATVDEPGFYWAVV